METKVCKKCGRELRRGECGYSNQTLGNRWGWSRGKVTRFLSHLENEKMIQQKKVSGFNVIKVLNFDNYLIEDYAPRERETNE